MTLKSFRSNIASKMHGCDMILFSSPLREVDIKIYLGILPEAASALDTSLVATVIQSSGEGTCG